MQILSDFFAYTERYSVGYSASLTMRIAYKPLGNGVPQRPFRPQAQAADTTVSTGLIPIYRGRREPALDAGTSDKEIYSRVSARTG